MPALKNINNVGKSYLYVQAIGATLSFAIGVAIAAYFYFRKDNKVKVDGVVMDDPAPDCVESGTTGSKQNQDKKFNCKFRVGYTVGEQRHFKNLDHTSGKRYAAGETVSLAVNKDDPSIADIWLASDDTVAYAISALCTLLLLVAWGRYLLASKVKGAGAGFLVMNGLSAISD